MGDGYCRHRNEEDSPTISKEFLAEGFRRLRT